MLKLKIDDDVLDYIEIVPTAEYVYGFEVVLNEVTTPTNYQIEFKTPYTVQLGPSATPIASFEMPVSVRSDSRAQTEFRFEYYNLIDIGNTNGKILNGVLDTHRKYFRNTLRRDFPTTSNLHCRKSVTCLNNTVSGDGTPNMSPPIVRTRRAALRDGLGDTFWYLEDTTYASTLPCGIQQTNNEPTVTLTADTTDPQDELDLSSLELNYTFEGAGDGVVLDLSLIHI